MGKKTKQFWAAGYCYVKLHFSSMKNSEDDLQQFIKAFDPNKFKILKSGIEIRGISDIHRNISLAKELIQKLKLRLDVRHNAEMTAYGGFEVIKI